MLSHLSLKYRIALIIFLLEALLMGVVLVQTLGRSSAETSALIESQQQVIVQLASGIARPALVTEEYADLQPYIDRLINNSQATRMHLADGDRTIIASSQSSELGKNLTMPEDRPYHTWMVREMRNATGLLGIVAIEFSNKELDETYREARDFGVGIALVGMLIIAAVGILVGFFLTRRLETITRAAVRLAQGDFSVRTDLDQKDELGALARAFDQMAQNLQSKEESLNQTLSLLQRREQDLAITLSSIGDAVIATNARGEVTRMNPVAERLTGWSLSKARGLPLSKVFPIIDAPSREPVSNPVEKVISSGKVIHLSNHTTLVNRKGKEYQIADSAAPIRDQDGTIQGVVLVFNDVSEQYLLRERARDVLQQLQGLLREMQTMVAILDLDGRIVFINNRPLKRFGLSAEQVLERVIWEQGLFSQQAGLSDEIRNCVRQAGSGTSVERDLNFATSEGSIWVNFSVHPVFNDEGRVSQLLVEGHDISERKQAEEQVFYQAHYDDLTGLANRFLSLDRLSQMINDAIRKRELIAVLFIDLDDFKKVNDSMGHDTGDELLVQAADRLQSSIRAGDTVGRLGGDEFIVLLPGIKDNAEAQPVAENLLNRFRQPFLVDKRELTLTLSIGIAIFPDDGNNPSDILRNADTAMYHAKKNGRNTCFYYAEHMNESVERRLEIEEQFHGAIERGEFAAYFQPQFELQTGRVLGAEALLRWHNQTLGEVTPTEFIPIAERTGFILQLGRFVITQALQQTREWRDSFNPDFKIAVNLSPRQFRDTNLVSHIKESLGKCALPGEALELEITEGVLMSGLDSVDEALAELNEIGVRIALDDFGTGYASLSYLQRYPFDVLKIDKSFVREVNNNHGDQELVTAAIAMAHGMNLQVVAEGVEMPQQLDLLDELGCNVAQGFLLGEPMPAEEMQAVFAQQTSAND